jgi:hypothetical protein
LKQGPLRETLLGLEGGTERPCLDWRAEQRDPAWTGEVPLQETLLALEDRTKILLVCMTQPSKLPFVNYIICEQRINTVKLKLDSNLCPVVGRMVDNMEKCIANTIVKSQARGIRIVDG